MGVAFALIAPSRKNRTFRQWWCEQIGSSLNIRLWSAAFFLARESSIKERWRESVEAVGAKSERSEDVQSIVSTDECRQASIFEEPKKYHRLFLFALFLDCQEEAEEKKTKFRDFFQTNLAILYHYVVFAKCCKANRS